MYQQIDSNLEFSDSLNALAAPGGNGWNRVALFNTEGKTGELVFELEAGADLSHLRVTGAAVLGGDHFSIATDADFATATDKLIEVYPNGSISTSVANTPLKFKVKITSDAEIAVECKVVGDAIVAFKGRLT